MRRDLEEGYVLVNGTPCYEVPEFDGSEDQLKQIVPAGLVEPLERMFLRLSEIRAVRHSFGKPCLNLRVVVEELEADAVALEKACKDLWREC